MFMWLARDSSNFLRATLLRIHAATLNQVMRPLLIFYKCPAIVKPVMVILMA